MRANYLLPVISVALFFTSCREKGPVIELTPKPVARDTSYISSKLEAPDKKVVLVEELTGASCVPCVPARELLAGIQNTHPAQLAIMEIHIIDNSTTTGPAKPYNKYDLRTEDGTELQKAFQSHKNGVPSASIDRVPIDNVNSNLSLKWAGAIDNELKKTPPVNIRIKSNFDESARNAVITVTASYTQAVPKKQFLSVAILEKDIVDAQKTPNGLEKEYTFKHTFRDIITDIKGDEFLKDQPTKDAGRVYERTFIHPVDANWKPEKCMVVAFVHNGEESDKEVLQAAEAELKGQ